MMGVGSGASMGAKSKRGRGVDSEVQLSPGLSKFWRVTEGVGIPASIGIESTLG